MWYILQSVSVSGKMLVHIDIQEFYRGDFVLFKFKNSLFTLNKNDMSDNSSFTITNKSLKEHRDKKH